MRAGSAVYTRARESAADPVGALEDTAEAWGTPASQASQNRAPRPTSWPHPAQIMDGRLLQPGPLPCVQPDGATSARRRRWRRGRR
jgi:hypothetical protein